MNLLRLKHFLNSKSVFYGIIYLLLFTLGLHLFRWTGYILILFDLIILIKVILNKQLRLTPQFLFVILFSVAFFVFYITNYGFAVKQIIVYLVSPPCLFMFGQSLFISSSKEERTKLIYKSIFSILLGMLLCMFLSMAFTMSKTGLAFYSERRVFYLIWQPNEVMSSTHYSLYADAVFCFALPILFGKYKNKNAFHYIFGILAILFSVYGSIILANRSFFVVIFIAIWIYGILYLIPKFSQYINREIAFFAAMTLITLFIVLILSANIFGLKDELMKINVFKRFIEGGSDASRWHIYETFFNKFSQYPFGGMVKEITYETSTNYIHNVILDVYMLCGIIPFIIFIVIFIFGLIGFAGLVKQKENLHQNIAVEMGFLGLIGVFFFEPVIQGDIYIFDFVFIFFGFFDLCYHEYIVGAKHKRFFKKFQGRDLKIVFISNFISLHTRELHDELTKKYGDLYHFISVEKPSDRHLIYEPEQTHHNEVNFEQNQVEALRLLDEADVIIYGSVNRKLINKYRRKDKIIFDMRERIYKGSKYQYLSLHAFISSLINIRRFENHHEFALAMSGYNAYDASLYLNRPNHIYEWGYYPLSEVNHKITFNKTLVLTYNSRLIDWKNPFVVLETALKMKQSGLDFKLNFIGSGDLSEQVHQYVEENNLNDNIIFYENISNIEVKNILYQSDILVHSASFKEGWGAVINEGLAAGCLVIASYAAGSSISLIHDGKNGILFDPETTNDLYNKIIWATEHESQVRSIRECAANTYLEKYSPAFVAERFANMLSDIVNTGECTRYEDGPCSKAKVISDESVQKYVAERTSLYAPKVVKNENTSEKKKFISSTLISYFTIFFNILAALFYTPWMINQIGQSSYGLYSLTLSITAIVTLNLGIGSVLARYIAKYRSEGKDEEANNFSGIVFKIYSVLAAIVLAALIIIYFLLGKIYVGLTPDEISKLKIIFLIVGLFAVVGFEFSPVDGIFEGNEKYVPLKIIKLIRRILDVLLVIIFLSLGMGLYAFVIISVACELIEIIIKVIYLKKNGLAGSKPNFRYADKNVRRAFLTFSGWTILIAVANLLLTSINQSVLGIFSNSTQISFYAIAALFEGYTWKFSDAINGLFIPKLTRLDNNPNGQEEIERILIKVFRIQLLIVGFIIIGIIAIGRGFINNIWKQGSDINYDPCYLCTIFLLIPGLFTYPNGVITNLFFVRNKVKYLSISNLVAGIISILLACILSWKFPENASILVCVSICTGKLIGLIILLSVFEQKVLHLNMAKIMKEAFLPIIALLLVIFGILFGSEFLIETNNYLVLAIKIISIVIIYVALSYFFVLKSDEKQLVWDILRPVSSIDEKEHHKDVTNYFAERQQKETMQKKPKKVLAISTFDYGAPYRIAISILDELKDRGYETYYACRSSTNENYISINRGEFNYRREQIKVKVTGKDGFYNFTDTAVLIEKIANINPDLIILNNLHGHFINLNLLWNYIKERQIQVIWILHDMWTMTGKCALIDNQCDHWKNGCEKCPFKKKYPSSVFVPQTQRMFKDKMNFYKDYLNLTFVPVSNYVNELFEQSALSQCKHIIIENGVSTHNTKADKDLIQIIRQRYCHKGQKLIFGCANYLSAVKGIDYFNYLAEHLGDEYSIVLAGHKSKGVKYHPRLHIVDYLTNDELNAYYQAADIFASLTPSESFGMVYLEAMLNGTPVLTFNTGLFYNAKSNDFVQVVNINNYKQLVEAVTKLNKTEQVSKLAIEFAKQYSDKKMLKNYIELIEKELHHE